MPSTMRTLILFLSLALLSNIGLYSQKSTLIFRHINIEDGLAGTEVSSIIQDNNGFIWIATNNGLQRYDGHSFTTYHHNPLDSESISSDNLYALVQDNEQNIWAISFLSGIIRFNPAANKCLPINGYDKRKFKEFFISRSMFMDRQGNIWLIGEENIACYYKNTNQIISIKNKFPKSLHPLFMDAKYDPVSNRLWIADGNIGICLYDLNTQHFYDHDDNPDHLLCMDLDFKPTKIYIDRQKNLWAIANEIDLARWSPLSNKVVSYQVYSKPDGTIVSKSTTGSLKAKPVSISCMMEDSHGGFWMGSGSLGLIQYNAQKDSFIISSQQHFFNNYFSYNSDVNCLFEDREGNIWIGTDKGINVFNPYRQPFHFFENASVGSSVKNQVETMDFMESPTGGLYIATWGKGLTIFDKNLNFKKSIVYNKRNHSSLAEPGNRVWAIIKDAQNNLLLGCQHAFITSINLKTNHFINTHPKGLKNLTIMSMRKDEKQNIWMGLYSGIAKYDPKNNSATAFQHFLPYEGVSVATCSDILPDNHGNIWAGTLGLGLQKFDPSKNNFTEIFVPEKNNPYSIPSTVINCMLQLNDSMIAIATGSGGVAIFNPDSKKFYSIGIADGLPSNNISSMYFIPPSTLWATALNVICKINISTKRVTQYGADDGIRDLDFSSSRHMYRMQDGRLLVGYTGGVLYFNPDSIRIDDTPVNVTITGIKIFGQGFPVNPISHQIDTIELSYKQNFLTIQYASLSYLGSNRVNYFYQLEGIDRNWVNAYNQRFATYTNLPGGTYHFKVKCENSNGTASRSVTSLTIIIHPPFWQTWWFKLLSLFAFTSLLYVFFKYRINELVKMQAIRNEISKDLHDDVGATLSSISILSKVANDKIKDGQLEQSTSIISKIDSYSKETVEKMGDIVWAVNSNHDSILDITARLKKNSIEAASAKNILLQFLIEPSLHKIEFPMHARKDIYLICKEAINNAIKYSECKKIVTEFKTLKGKVQIEISDDGKGFDSDQAIPGNGLVNMKSRAAEMKASFTIDSGNNGTKIHLVMSIPRNR